MFESLVGDMDELKEEVRIFGEVLDADGIPFRVQVSFGDFFETIPRVLDELKSDLVVVGTHGIRGIQRNLYSENILRLINSMKTLTLVVQGHSDIPPEGYTKISCSCATHHIPSIVR